MGLGYEVVKRMGIEHAVRAAGYDIQSIRSVGSSGQVNAELSVDVVRSVIGQDSTSLARGDLAAAVYATTAGSIETMFR